jgi:hypothetical protein
MSVDTRLRQARPEDDGQWDAGLDVLHGRVVRLARLKRIRMTSVAAGAAAAVLAVGGLTVTLRSDGHPSRAPFSPTSTESPSGSSAKATTPVDGEWRTKKIDRQDVIATLEAGGISRSVADDFVTSLPEGEFRYRMSYLNGLLSAHVGHGPAIFTQFVTVSKTSLTMTPLTAGSGHWTYDWRRDGDRLTLDLRRTTVHDYDGFPAKVHALAMFCVTPFIHAR